VKFSLRSLIVVTAFAGLASAALAKPSGDWLTVVVSLAAITFVIQILRALFQSGESRAAAAGWLLFATAYLLLVFAPWTRAQIGPGLLSSQALSVVRPQATPPPTDIDLALSWTGSTIIGNSSAYTINVNSNTSYALMQSLLQPSPPNELIHATFFYLSGHWLSAWLAGWIGALVAAAFHRRGSGCQRPAGVIE